VACGRRILRDACSLLELSMFWCVIAVQVLMFVNVSGDTENVSESFYSLTFASRCRATALGEARKNVTALRKPSPTAAGSAGASGRGPSPKYVNVCCGRCARGFG
jgi:hypothetical protein